MLPLFKIVGPTLLCTHCMLILLNTLIQRSLQFYIIFVGRNFTVKVECVTYMHSVNGCIGHILTLQVMVTEKLDKLEEVIDKGNDPNNIPCKHFESWGIICR